MNVPNLLRRNEKAITDPAALDAVIGQAVVCRLGLAENNKPYVVPLSFGYADRMVYLHGALEGRKIDMIRKNPAVCVQFDANVQVVPSENACKWGMRYQSVIGFGTASILENPAEKHQALQIIMQHYSDVPFSFPDHAIASTAVLRIAIAHLTGKQSGY